MSVHFCGRMIDPAQVVYHEHLAPAVKREILASWASDLWAVRGQPALRCPPELVEPASIDDILAALRLLDGTSEPGIELAPAPSAA